ncbi:YggT family protein [Marininema mesophilum]|uniref:YggT family protein n=1 Tax=Marininema mesophilum TaxID=1048340 RepID=A0A1H2QE03_9BACL|nr:YggT family protein [Marininema mesophilum]SDW04884.1 YggT family protein [Marininema mesophilum]
MNIFAIVDMLFNIYSVVLVIYILMSWIPQLRESAIGTVIGWIAEPYLSVFRRFIPPIGMIDISPIIALFALRFVQQGVFFIIELILRNM